MLVNCINVFLSLGYSERMSIRASIIILPLSIVPHCFLTKTSNLMFIVCHNIRLQSCLMVVMRSVRAPSGHGDVCACAHTFLYYIHYINADLCCNLIIDG